MNIIRRIPLVLFVASLAIAFGHFDAGAAQSPGVQLGQLTCKTLPGTKVQRFLTSSVAVNCTFKTPHGEERYKGEMGLLGIDLSKKSQETLYFTVVGVVSDVRIGKHSLVGEYLGTSASVGIVEKGYGSTSFVGGVKKSFSLVPSLDTFKGTGITAGASRMHLDPAK